MCAVRRSQAGRACSLLSITARAVLASERRAASGCPAFPDARRLRPEKTAIESCEHQDDADIYDQPFHETVSEEREIDSHDDGGHRRHVKHDSYFAHFKDLHLWPWI
jgi:hypothetical protein